MADVLGKIGESIISTLKEATEQTQKSVDQVACRTELINKNNELKKLLLSLGEAQYKLYENDPSAFADATVFEEVKLVKKQIAILEEKLEQIIAQQKDSFAQYKDTVKTNINDVVNECKDVVSKDNSKDACQEEEEAEESEESQADEAEINAADETLTLEKEKVEVLKICPVCQTPNHSYAAYCMKCGTKFQ